MSRWISAAPLLGAALMLTLAVGCPATPPKAGGDTPPPTPEPNTETPASDAPADGIYRFPIDKTIPTLDPVMITDTVSSSIANQIFDGLVKINPQGELEPNLAETYEVDPAGLVYTFHLRSGVKFQNGRELTADDVAFSLDRVLDPASGSPKTLFLDPLSGAMDRMEHGATSTSGIVVKDPLTIELHLDRSNSLFPWYLAQSTCYIVPKEEVAKGEDSWARNPVGTGPFMKTDETYDFNQGITLVANPDYFKGAPHLKGIKYTVEKEDKKRFEGFRAGLYEHTDIPPLDLQTVLDDPALKSNLVERPTFDLYAIAFNCEKAPFKGNKALRQALNYAIDKNYIVETVLKNTWVIAPNYLPVNFPNYTPPNTGYAYDPQKAQDLLKEAGYPEGKGLPTLELWVDTKEVDISIMEAVQSDLNKIGVKAELKTLEWSSFLAAMDQGQHMLGQQTWLMDYPDADNILYVLLDSKNIGAPGNWARYSNPDFDKLVEAAQIEPDQAKRMALYQQAEQIAYDECPWIPLFNRKCQILKQPYVTGLELTTLDRAPVIPGVDLEKVAFQ